MGSNIDSSLGYAYAAVTDSAADAATASGTVAATDAARTARSARAAAYAADAVAASVGVGVAKSVNSAAAYAARVARSARGAADTTAYTVDAAAKADWKKLKDGSAPSHLLQTSLWLQRGVPGWASRAWRKMKRDLLELDQGWVVWTRWYEDVLSGKPFVEALEFDCRLAIHEETWEQGPAILNAEIKRRTALFAVHSQKQTRLGVQWRESSVGFAAVREGDVRDEAAVRDPKVGQLHEALQRKLSEFSKRYPDLEDDYGWEGFENCRVRLETCICQPLTAIPSNVMGLYDAAVELGTYLDLHQDLLKRSIGNQAALDPLPARAFTDLVRTSALFVRAFPSALEADEEITGFLTRPDIFAPAIVVIEAAGRRMLISREDADWVLGLLRAGQRDGFPAQKAGGRGVNGVRNLAVMSTSVLAGFLMGAVASDYSTKSPFVQGIGDFLVEVEGEITEILVDGHADLRHAVASLIEEAKQSTPQQGSFKVGVSDETRRWEEDES